MLLRAATRGSPLALWQAEHVAALLRSVDPTCVVELVLVSTAGDRRQDVAIHLMGGKGVFAKEVQAAVLEGRADVAVHSAKDLPSVTPPGLVIGAVPARGEVRDALVGCTLAQLPLGALVASGSVRRRAQLAAYRPDLRFCELRGNIGTRLGALGRVEPEGIVAALVMAAVAIERLGVRPSWLDLLDTGVMLPQAGQGALAVECRSDDAPTQGVLQLIDDPAARGAVDAERAFLAALGGDCDLPAGALATVGPPGLVSLTALLAAEDGSVVLREQSTGVDPAELGTRLAERLLSDPRSRELLVARRATP